MKSTAPIRVAFLLAALILPVSTPAQTADDSAASNRGPNLAPGEFVVPRVTWRIRNVIGNERLLKWHAALDGNAFGTLGLLEAAPKVDALSLNAIEASSAQTAGPQIPKKLDARLTAEERATVKSGLRSVRLAAYRVDSAGADEKSRRELFQFAKDLGVEVIVAPLEPAAVDDFEKLAKEFGIDVALRGRPDDVAKAIGGRAKRIGAAADTGEWLQAGIKPVDAFAALKDRIVYVSLRDRSAVGPGGHDVLLGLGAGGLPEFLKQLSRLNSGPKVIVIGRTEAARTYADVAKNVDAFEETVRPALGEFVTATSRELPIRGLQNFPPDQRKAIEDSGTNYIIGHWMMSQMNVNLPADVRQKIDEALPKSAPAKPKKARKLLVIDACVANMSHNVIPHANYAIEQMGKKTGAYEAVFSNDFNNLKYPRIKQFDAIFLNSTVGELFPDQEVRDGLTRFVREGGGIALLHGATYASRNWPEFAEMVGAADGPHRVQSAVLKIEHPDSPITKPFPPDFRYSDEYYRFYDTGPTAWLSRDKVHVLFSIDLEKTPDFNQGRPPFIRQDNDYPICWIKSYGKGRVFENAMGHTPELFMTPPLAAHILAGIQFVLGDLEDDTKPGGKVAKK